ncbi:pol polyprotein-like protein, partial [Leptotrombidium deliense]
SERNLSAIEIELLAIICAIKRFLHYLIGRYFEIVTDSNPLTFLMRSENHLCDLMSRKPIENNFKDFMNKQRDTKTNVICDMFLVSLKNIRDLQINDVYFGKIINILKGNLKANKSLRKAAFKYEMIEGKLYRVDKVNNEFVNLLAVPKCLINNVLIAMHDCIYSGGHFGIRKTFERVRQRFYWRTMHSDVIKYVISCPKCQKTKPRKYVAGKLKPIQPGDRPFSKIGIDVIGMLPRTKHGNRFIIVAICYLTKYCITAAVPNVTAKDIAYFLLHKIILQFSVFDEMISDNGPQFRSEVIKELNQLLSSTHRFTTPYNPSTSGLVERCNKEVNQLIRSYVEKDSVEWDTVVPFITFLYNSSFHSSIKFTPFYLVYGFEPKFPIENENCALNNIETTTVREIKEKLNEARNHAKRNILIAQNKYKRNFDKHHSGNEFTVGDKVLVNYPLLLDAANKKYSDRWIGPFTITHKINELLYEVEADDGNAYFDKIHINKLKPFVTRNKECTITEQLNVNREGNELRKSQRIRNVPKYLKDYYLGK